MENMSKDLVTSGAVDCHEKSPRREFHSPSSAPQNDLVACRPKDSELSGMQRMAVSIVAAYYTAMLLMWTAPAVLQAKVAAEERGLAVTAS
jgi:hypothetical protein